MPTKLGKGGHGPQEYVPEGNGKASGTYADDNGVNIYGSFKTFKKPDDSGQTTGQTQETPKTNEKYYFRKNGMWYYVKPENLENYKAWNPNTKFYTEEEKKEFDKKKQEKKNQPPALNENKKTYIRNLEDNIKSKVSKNCIVNFSGFDENGCKLMQESFNAIYNDFEEIGNYLFELGTQSGISKEKEYARYQQFEQFKQNITQEQIDEYRQKLIKWNSSTDPSKFTDEYVKETLISMNRPGKTRKLLTGSTQGCFVSYGRGKGGIQYLTTVGKKDYADKVLNNFNSNWWSSKNPNSVMTHELGHAVDYMIFDLEKSSYGDTYREQIRNIYAEENKKIREKKSSMQKTEGNIYGLSKYGMTNLKEFIAESFAAYYGGDNNPIANKVMGIMKEAYKTRINEIKRRSGGNSLNG